MQIFIVFLFWLFFGTLTAIVAHYKKRDPKMWFLVGVLLGIGGLLIALFLPKKTKESSSPFSLFKQKAQESASQEIIKPQNLNPEPTQFQQSQLWYYLDPSHQQFGPIHFSALKDLYTTSQISEKTFIWTEGMENWKRLHEHPTFSDIV